MNPERTNVVMPSGLGHLCAKTQAGEGGKRRSALMSPGVALASRQNGRAIVKHDEATRETKALRFDE